MKFQLLARFVCFWTYLWLAKFTHVLTFLPKNSHIYECVCLCVSVCLWQRGDYSVSHYWWMIHLPQALESDVRRSWCPSQSCQILKRFTVETASHHHNGWLQGESKTLAYACSKRALDSSWFNSKLQSVLLHITHLNWVRFGYNNPFKQMTQLQCGRIRLSQRLYTNHS